MPPDKLVITQYVPMDAPLAANIELAMFTIQSRAKPLRGWRRGSGSPSNFVSDPQLFRPFFLGVRLSCPWGPLYSFLTGSVREKVCWAYLAKFWTLSQLLYRGCALGSNAIKVLRGCARVHPTIWSRGRSRQSYHWKATLPMHVETATTIHSV